MRSRLIGCTYGTKTACMSGMNRRRARVGLTVAHKHCFGEAPPVDIVSELAVLRGQPKAILEWIDLGGVRTPICVDLEPGKLTDLRCGRYAYEAITVDPRADDLSPDGGRIEARATPR